LPSHAQPTHFNSNIINITSSTSGLQEGICTSICVSLYILLRRFCQLLQLLVWSEKAGLVYWILGGFLAPKSRAAPNAPEALRAVLKSNSGALSAYFAHLDENDILVANGLITHLLGIDVHLARDKNPECACAATQPPSIICIVL